MCSWNSQLTYKSQSSGMFCVNKNNMTRTNCSVCGGLFALLKEVYVCDI